MFKRRDVDSQASQASQFGIKVALVDFEREMVQRGRLEHRVEDFARLSFAETSAGDKSLIRRR